MKTTLLLLIASVSALTLNSCIPLAAGAAAGYVAHKEGYRMQSPVKKTQKEPEPEAYDSY